MIKIKIEGMTEHYTYPLSSLTDMLYDILDQINSTEVELDTDVTFPLNFDTRDPDGELFVTVWEAE